jgi:hypothetical protein
VGLVDDGTVPGRVRRPVALPVEGAVDHHAERHAPGVILLVEGQVGVVAGAQGIAEHRCIPVDLPEQRPGVRIEQELVRVEAVAGQRLERAGDTIPVELAGA